MTQGALFDRHGRPFRVVLFHRLSEVLKPFAKGELTLDGVQYSTAVTGVTHTEWGVVEAVEIPRPLPYAIEEIEFGLTMGIRSDGDTQDVLWKFQASDDGVDWEDLIPEQTRSAPAQDWADVTAAGRFAPTGNFLGTGPSIHIRGVIQAESATETAEGRAKNSSYIIVRHRRD